MQQELVERERELERLDELLCAARIGGGAVLFIIGEAGVGKSRLVAEAARRGVETGMEVLRARGGELERQLPFGVVRQLFEARLPGKTSVGRGGLFEGAAELARPVFDLSDASGAGAGEDPSFAVLHGLYWLTANLAARCSLVLLVDDAHWADRASRRWLEYLARRVEALPVLLVIAARARERGPPDDALDVLMSLSVSSVVRPRPFTGAGSARLLRCRWPPADDVFCDACHGASGGNPFLLGELIEGLVREQIEPRARNDGRVRELGPESVSQAVVSRLGGLSPDAAAVARAVAVLSAGADVSAVARLIDWVSPRRRRQQTRWRRWAS